MSCAASATKAHCGPVPNNLIQVNDEAQSRAAHLASLAVRALLEEAELTPKPALVDKRVPGAHTDLSLALMRRSARCLRLHFEAMALASFQKTLSQNVREELGAIGRVAELSMLSITGGINTHRRLADAVWLTPAGRRRNAGAARCADGDHDESK
jgi:triphosphoribosyl-dephospho-CoA synthase